MPPEEAKFDAVVIGAGFAGMYMLIKLRELGFTATVFEAADDVGGTWYWNRYPGARCDVESMEYSYSFDEQLQQEWEWSERYPTQPEILRYAQHVADRFDIRRDVRFGTRVQSAAFDDRTGRWLVTTDQGDETSSQFLITAVGCLSAANMPNIAGRDSFAGDTFHTGLWPHGGVDFTGKRVAVIGTGSSGIQSIPMIAKQAEHLTVFQRTAQFAVPARNTPLAPEDQAAIKADYKRFREEQYRQPGALGARLGFRTDSVLDYTDAEIEEEYERRWAQGGFTFLGAFGDTANVANNHYPAEFVKRKIREAVHDPKVAELLIPKTLLGCKRLVLDTDYFATYNRPNVSLVDISETPISEITPTGIRVEADDYEVDTIVFATGFDAMTGSLLRMDIRGRNGIRLADEWEGGPRTYLGMAVVNFPNMFTITGPGSPSVLANVITCAEQHVQWIGECLASMRSHDQQTISASRDAADAWVQHVNRVADSTLLSTCDNWYVGANIPGKPRVFMPLPGFPAYVERCNMVVASGYEGFDFEPAAH